MEDENPAQWIADRLEYTYTPEDVLEFSHIDDEGPVALLTYGGPTVCATPCPLLREYVVVHWSHGNEHHVARAHAPGFRRMMADRCGSSHPR